MIINNRVVIEPEDLIADSEQYNDIVINSSLYCITGSVDTNLSGIYETEEGTEINIINRGDYLVTIKHQDLNSLESNRFFCCNESDIILRKLEEASAVYKDGFWRVRRKNPTNSTYYNGTKVDKTLIKAYYRGTLNSSGECTINATDDNTELGNALFEQIIGVNPQIAVTSSDVVDLGTLVLQTALTANIKTLGFKGFRGRNLASSGDTFRACADGTPYIIEIIGY